MHHETRRRAIAALLARSLSRAQLQPHRGKAVKAASHSHLSQVAANHLEKQPAQAQSTGASQ